MSTCICRHNDHHKEEREGGYQTIWSSYLGGIGRRRGCEDCCGTGREEHLTLRSDQIRQAVSQYKESTGEYIIQCDPHSYSYYNNNNVFCCSVCKFNDRQIDRQGLKVLFMCW